MNAEYTDIYGHAGFNSKQINKHILECIQTD